MKISSKFILAACGALLLASCNSNNADGPMVTEQTLTGYYNVFTNLATGEKTIVKDMSYNIARNLTDGTAQITLKNLKLPDNQSYPSFSVGPVSWTYDKEWMNIHAINVPISSASGIYPLIADFTFDSYVKYLNDVSGTTYTNIGYNIGNDYHVDSYPLTLVAWGKTESRINGIGFVFDTTSSVYVTELDPEKNMATLTINYFSVAVDNSYQAVVIKEIPYSFASDGTFSMSKAEGAATIFGMTESSENSMPVKDLSFTIKRGVINLKYQITVDNTTYDVTCTEN